MSLLFYVGKRQHRLLKPLRVQRYCFFLTYARKEEKKMQKRPCFVLCRVSIGLPETALRRVSSERLFTLGGSAHVRRKLITRYHQTANSNDWHCLCTRHKILFLFHNRICVLSESPGIPIILPTGHPPYKPSRRG